MWSRKNIKGFAVNDADGTAKDYELDNLLSKSQVLRCHSWERIKILGEKDQELVKICCITIVKGVKAYRKVNVCEQFNLPTKWSRPWSGNLKRIYDLIEKTNYWIQKRL